MTRSILLLTALSLACANPTDQGTGQLATGSARIEPAPFSVHNSTPPIQPQITGLTLFDCHGNFLGNWGRSSATGWAYPNPFRDTTWFVYALGDFSVIEITVERAIAPGAHTPPSRQNSNGAVIPGEQRQVVWSMESYLDAGVFHTPWSGQTSNGETVEPGYYRIQVSIPSRGLAVWYDVLYAADVSDVPPGVSLYTDCPTPDPWAGDD